MKDLLKNIIMIVFIIICILSFIFMIFNNSKETNKNEENTKKEKNYNRIITEYEIGNTQIPILKRIFSNEIRIDKIITYDILEDEIVYSSKEVDEINTYKEKLNKLNLSNKILISPYFDNKYIEILKTDEENLSIYVFSNIDNLNSETEEIKYYININNSCYEITKEIYDEFINSIKGEN